MPFTVEPSKLVDIDDSGAGPDDFLLLFLEDGKRMFVRRRQEAPHYLVIDAELLPDGLVDASVVTARQFLQALGQRELDKLQPMFAGRDNPSLDLLHFVAERLRLDAWVSMVGGASGQPRPKLNIGETPQVSFKQEIGDIRVGGYFDNRWVASSPIKHVRPVTRFEALVILAKQSSG